MDIFEILLRVISPRLKKKLFCNKMESFLKLHTVGSNGSKIRIVMDFTSRNLIYFLKN